MNKKEMLDVFAEMLIELEPFNPIKEIRKYIIDKNFEKMDGDEVVKAMVMFADSITKKNKGENE